jgi:oligosaccharide repeat unit polymerase
MIMADSGSIQADMRTGGLICVNESPLKDSKALLLPLVAFCIIAQYSADGLLYGQHRGFVGLELAFSFLLMVVFPVSRLAGSRDMLEPFNIVICLYAVFYLVKVIDILVNGAFRNETNTSDLMISKALFLANIGIVCFCFGYSLPSANSNPRIPRLLSHWRRTDTIVVSFILILFGMSRFAGIIYGILAGSFDLSRRGLLLRGMGFTLIASFMYPIGIVMLYLLTVAKRRKKKHCVAAALFAVVMLIPFLALGSRGDFFVFVMAIVLLYNYFVRRIRLRHAIFLCVLLFLCSAGFLRFRGTGTVRNIFSPADRQLSCRGLLHESMMSFGGTEGFIRVLDSQIPKTYGSEYISVLTIYVPKAIWPNKPKLGIGIYFTNYFYPGVYRTGTTYGPSLLGAFYMNFGYWGIVTGMFALGLVLKKAYLVFKANRDNMSLALIYSILMPVVCFKAVSQSCSDMIAFIPAILFSIVPAMLAMSFMAGAVPTGGRRADE